MLGGQGDVICPDSTPNCTLEDYGAVDNSNAARYGNLFWSALPPGQGWLYAMLIIGNCSAVVASQAVITGSFTIIRQVSHRPSGY